MPEKKQVPDYVPRVHSPGPGQTEHDARMQDLALYEMQNNNQDIDPSAAPSFAAAELGTSSHARKSGPTTSPKIVFHDTPYSQIATAHPWADSADWEALLEYVLGDKSVYEASTENYASFSRERLDEVLSWDQIQAENFLGIQKFEQFDDDEEEDELEQ